MNDGRLHSTAGIEGTAAIFQVPSLRGETFFSLLPAEKVIFALDLHKGAGLQQQRDVRKDFDDYQIRNGSNVQQITLIDPAGAFHACTETRKLHHTSRDLSLRFQPSVVTRQLRVGPTGKNQSSSGRNSLKVHSLANDVFK